MEGEEREDMTIFGRFLIPPSLVEDPQPLGWYFSHSGRDFCLVALSETPLQTPKGVLALTMF